MEKIKEFLISDLRFEISTKKYKNTKNAKKNTSFTSFLIIFLKFHYSYEEKMWINENIVFPPRKKILR